MNRIIYIHSNILTMCCFKTVKESLDRNEKVIIITNRGYKWPFFNGSVSVYDFADIFQGEDKDRVALHSLRALKDYFRYRRYRTHLNRVVKKIIAGEDYTFYMPSMALDMTYIFAHNRHCKCYYYVDEGSLSYAPRETLEKYIPNKRKNEIKSLLGIKDHYHYETSSKFKGTISITKEAFEWNTYKEKIINTIEEYVSEVRQSIPILDDVIITAYLNEEFTVITRSLDFTIENIFSKNPNSRIGIKIHPHAVNYNKEKTLRVQNYLEEKYAGKLTQIPVAVSIEVMSIIYHPRLYSLFSLSSIILYGLLYHSSDTKLIDYEEGTVTIRDITSVEEYNRLVKIVNFRKIN